MIKAEAALCEAAQRSASDWGTRGRGDKLSVSIDSAAIH